MAIVRSFMSREPKTAVPHSKRISFSREFHYALRPTLRGGPLMDILFLHFYHGLKPAKWLVMCVSCVSRSLYIGGMVRCLKRGYILLAGHLRRAVRECKLILSRQKTVDRPQTIEGTIKKAGPMWLVDSSWNKSVVTNAFPCP